MAIQEYQKRPVRVQVLQWTGENIREVQDFCEGDRVGIALDGAITRYYNREGRKGICSIPLGHFIVKHEDGYIAQRSPEVFAKSYEEIKP